VTIELSELELVWPARLFAEEAQALLAAGEDDETGLGWLLDEAFHGGAAWRLFQQEATSTEVITSNVFETQHADLLEPRLSHAVLLVRKLAEEADELRRYVPRQYYRARQKPAAPPAPLGLPELKAAFAGMVAALDELGYFEREFGSSCVDDADDPAASGQRRLSELLDENQPGQDPVTLWPMKPGAGGDPSATWSDGLFYDLVEALHDLVARPRRRFWHDYGHEWDYTEFARRPGQAVYRWRVNELFGRSEVPLRLAESGPDTGRLVTSAGDARDDLIARVLESPETTVQERAERAVARFRDRHATVADKHEAARILADLLEHRRGLLKEQLLKPDEGALFQIANQFQIRHLDARQRADYDPVFLDWVFWWYLATVELTDRLLARQERD
jgi:hypothetical protein